MAWHESGNSDQIKKVFDDKIIALVKFRTTRLPTNFQRHWKRNVFYCQIAFKNAPITLEIGLVTVFLRSLQNCMYYCSSHVLWSPTGVFLSICIYTYVVYLMPLSF